MRRALRPEQLATVVATAAFVAFVALLPLALSDFRASQFAYVGIYFIAICGLDILTGYTGLISLGHGAFMAIGGYTTAILVSEAGWNYLVTIPIAGLVAGAVGLLLGPPSLRLSGLYLALATFGIAVATPAILGWDKIEGLTGGGTGINFFGDISGELGLSNNDWLYYLSWTIALALLAVAWLLLRGRIGRAFRAVRDSEVAATSSGVNLAVYKTLAFGISAFYAGVAGALFAIATLGYVSPQTFPVKLSIFLVVGAVAAGLGSLWGLYFGALLIFFLPTDLTPKIIDWLNAPLPKDLDPKAPGVSDFVFGTVLILVMILLPMGMAGLIKRVAGLTTRLYTRPH